MKANSNSRAAGVRPEYDPFLDDGIDEHEAAKFRGCSVRQLQALRVKGGGPQYYKMGRLVRYTRRLLIEDREQHRVSSTSEASARS